MFRSISAIAVVFVWIFIATSANALERSKIVKYLEEQKQCYLATGRVFVKAPGKAPSYDTRVLCVTDATMYPDTVREVKGCSFLVLDVYRGTLDTPFIKAPYNDAIAEDPKISQGQLFPMIEGRPCNNGGFESLMKRSAGSRLERKTIETVLSAREVLYSADQQMIDYLKNRAPQLQAEDKAKNETASRKQAALKKKYCQMVNGVERCTYPNDPAVLKELGVGAE